MSCCVPNCKLTYKNSIGLRFHHFPSDPVRCKEWMIACNRTDLLDKSPLNVKNKYVCGLHFEKTMYKHKYLQRHAVPSVKLTATADSWTQTLEPIKLLRPSILHNRIELRTSHTQTEEFMNNNLEIKKENDITHTQKHSVQCDELKIEDETQTKEIKLEVKEYETKIEDDETEIMSDEITQISTDSEQESEDEISEMTIDEFLKLNKGLENQIRNELRRKNIPQTPIENASCSKDVSKINENETDSEQESDAETVQRKGNESQSTQEPEAETSQMTVDEFLLHINERLEKQISKALKRKSSPQIQNAKNSKISRFMKKGTQTDDVAIFDIPKNNMCFEQCLRCGKNASWLTPKYTNRKHNSLVTRQDFENACEKYLSPTFCTTVKNQIELEFLTTIIQNQNQGLKRVKVYP